MLLVVLPFGRWLYQGAGASSSCRCRPTGEITEGWRRSKQRGGTTRWSAAYLRRRRPSKPFYGGRLPLIDPDHGKRIGRLRSTQGWTVNETRLHRPPLDDIFLEYRPPPGRGQRHPPERPDAADPWTRHVSFPAAPRGGAAPGTRHGDACAWKLKRSPEAGGGGTTRWRAAFLGRMRPINSTAPS